MGERSPFWGPQTEARSALLPCPTRDEWTMVPFPRQSWFTACFYEPGTPALADLRPIVREVGPLVPPPRESREEEEEAEEETAKPPVGRARKIRIYPTPKQRVLLKEWMDTTRWTYNQCVALIENDHVAKTKTALRARCLNAKG